MAQLDPSIRHAITPPQFGEDKYHREMLVDRLHGEIPRKLIAIAAPAGYGKTTLLADFVSHTELPVVWAQVTSADTDLMRLANLFLASIEKRFRRVRNLFDLQVYSSASPESLAAGINQLIDENIPENFVIIIDDVQLLHSSSNVMKFLDSLISTLPEQVTIMAAGQEVLEVSLAQLMADGDLAGFGAHDLAFTWEETSELLHRQGITDEEKISKIHENTRGWVTGIVLSEYATLQATFEAGLSEPLVYEYLSSVVLNRQSDQLRRFMLDSSVLPIMTFAACDFVLGLRNSQEFLNEIASKNLFISFTGQETYEFHPMFRSHLKETLKASDPTRYQRLSRKAAEFLRNESPERSFELFIELGEVQNAAEIADDHARKMFLGGQFQTIQTWYEILERNSVESRILSYYYSVMLTNQGSIEKALTIQDSLVEDPLDGVGILALIDKGFCFVTLRQQEELFGILEQVNSLGPSEFQKSARVHSLRLEALAAAKFLGDYQRAGELLENALELLEEEDRKDLVLKVLQDQSYCFGVSGNLEAARIPTVQSLEIASDIEAPLERIPSYTNLSQIELLTGRYQEALQTLETARGLANRNGSLRQEAKVLFYEADIYNDVGLSLQAGNLYEEALNLAAPIDDYSLLSFGCLGASVLQRRNGNYRLANDWFNRSREFSGAEETNAQRIQKAAIMLPSNPAEAVNLLSKDYQNSADTQSASEQVLEKYFMSKATYLLGNYEDALTEFSNCVGKAIDFGALHYIAAEIATDPEFWQWCSSSNDALAYMKQLEDQLNLILAFRDHYLPEESQETINGLIIKALGSAELIWNGEKISELKPQAMELFFLILDQGPVERDRIIEEFWPDHPPGRQTANLHMAVYSIRRILGKDSISLRGTAYELDPEIRLKYDVSEFENALRVFRSLPPGDPRGFFALTEAVNKYAGHFLPEFYSEWVEARRRDLELSYLDIAAHHADESLNRNQPSQALPTLRNALSIDPYRDDLNQRYLQALLDLGRRSEVITHFNSYRKMLSEDLGLRPASKVQEILDKAIGK